MQNLRYTITILSLTAVVMSGCTGGGGGPGGGFSMPPLPVEIDVAQVRQVADRFETLGTLEADEAVTVVAEIGGVL